MQEQKNELRGDSRTVSLDSGTLSRKVSNYERLFLQPVKTAALHGKALPLPAGKVAAALVHGGL